MLSSAADDVRAPQATFAPGRYVVRRMQRRDVAMDWAALRLDHNTGRLFRQPANGAGPLEEVREDLYMVLNVRRYPDGTRPEFYAQRDWSGFRDALQTGADARAAPLDKVTERMVGVLEDGRSRDWRDGLLLKWATVSSRLDVYATRHADLDKIDKTGCPVSDMELQRRMDAAEREVRDAVRALRADYQLAAAAGPKDAAGKVTKPEFRQNERERVVSQVAGYFMPWSSSGAAQATFADVPAFEQAYVDSASTGDLAGTALAAARAKASGTSCADLLSR